MPIERNSDLMCLLLGSMHGKRRAEFRGTVFATQRMHILALVLGCAILSAVLWDSFETLVLPRTPVRKLRLTRLFYRATWGPWIARARTLRSDRRRAGFLAVYGPISLIGLLTLWAAGLVVGFALLQCPSASGRMSPVCRIV
jgi:hypothetical protein